METKQCDNYEKFLIDINKRTISIPNNFHFLAVLKDTDAQTVKFEVDRYYNGVDLSEYTCVIQFANVDCRNKTLNEGVYPVTEYDLDTDGKICFDWTIRSEVTEYSGSMGFSVRFYETVLDEDGKPTLSYCLNTKIAILPILNSLDVVKTEYEKDSALLEEWNQRMQKLYNETSDIADDTKNARDEAVEASNDAKDSADKALEYAERAEAAETDVEKAKEYAERAEEARDEVVNMGGIAVQPDEPENQKIEAWVDTDATTTPAIRLVTEDDNPLFAPDNSEEGKFLKINSVDADGKVTLEAVDAPGGNVNSVNNKTGDVVLTAEDVGAMSATEAQQALDTKTVKRLLKYTGTNITDENNVVLNFKQIYDMLMDSPDFVIIVYGNRVYHPAYISYNEGSNSYIYFNAVMIDGGITKTNRIYIKSDDGVAVTSISIVAVNNENTANKVTSLENADDTHYPSAKAVADEVSELKRDLASKATNPEAPIVGRWCRVKKIDSDGNPIWETATLPIADNTNAGVICVNPAYAISISGIGKYVHANTIMPQIYASCENTIFISKGTLNNVLANPSIMPTLTPSEQAAAIARIGITVDESGICHFG